MPTKNLSNLSCLNRSKSKKDSITQFSELSELTADVESVAKDTDQLKVDIASLVQSGMHEKLHENFQKRKLCMQM